jgi:MinD superfamily P-loop ATPase
MVMPELDAELCNNCGLCVVACHGGSIVCEEGKTRVVKSERCDFCGVCEAVCPQGAIRCCYTILTRECGIES